MAALIPGYKYYNNIVNFDLPDGSTSLGYIMLLCLFKFYCPDGSTYWVPKYYNFLVTFDHPDASTS